MPSTYMRMVVPVVAVAPHSLQRDSGRQFSVAGVPGMDVKDSLRVVKLQGPFDCDHTVRAHLESGVVREVGRSGAAGAAFKAHCRTEKAVGS